MLNSLKTRAALVLQRSPFLFFFTALALLFGVIAITHWYRQPVNQEKTVSSEPKSVSTFIIGTDIPTTTASASVHKETVQPIVSLIAGTVQSIAIRPGDHVSSQTTLLRLSPDYGTNKADLETSLTEENQRFIENINRLDRSILTLEKKAARHDNTLDDTEETLALKRLKRERAALQESLATGALSVNLSRAEEAVFKPRSFVSATVEHVAVRAGDFVTPGTILAVLRAENGTTTLEATLDPSLARLLDTTTPSQLQLENGESVELLPSYLSQGETPDGLFMVRYLLSKERATKVINGTRLTINLPLRAPQSATLVPLDSLFTHTDHTSLFTAENNLAQERTVTVLAVFGNVALIKEVLPEGTALLLDRTLINGESITLAR